VTGTQSQTILYKHQKLDIMEVKDLLLCFISVIKHLPEGNIINHLPEADVIKHLPEGNSIKHLP